MDWTASQRKVLSEGEFDSHEVIEYKIQTALERAREMEGWDVFATPREQNINLMGEDLRTVAARFFEEDVAREWAVKADSDKAGIQKWFDERFRMPCYIATATWYSPEYQKPVEESQDYGSRFIDLRDEIKRLEAHLAYLEQELDATQVSPDLRDLGSDKDVTGGAKHIRIGIKKVRHKIAKKEAKLAELGQAWRMTLNDPE
jgi:hypothetical protein